MQCLVEVTGVHDLSMVATPSRDDNTDDKISSDYIAQFKRIMECQKLDRDFKFVQKKKKKTAHAFFPRNLRTINYVTLSSLIADSVDIKK